jgi:hydrogenase-4 component B
MTVVILVCAACWLVLAAAAVAIGRSPAGSTVIYGGSLLLAVVSLVAGTIHLLGHAAPAAVTLPLGLPWIGAHFRLDALSAFFIVVVDLGAATASLFAIGY